MLAILTAILALAPASPTRLDVHAPSPGREDVFPSAALTDEGLLVAWVARTPLRAEILYVESADLMSFTVPQTVSGAIEGTETIRPHVAARGRRAVVVWADASRGDLDVYAAISSDGGRTFSTPAVVAGGPGNQSAPRAAVLADGAIAVAFQDDFGSTQAANGRVLRVRIARAEPDAAFSPARAALDVDPRVAFDLDPALAGAGTSSAPLALVALERRHDGASEVRMVRSRDGGHTFSEPPVALGSTLGDKRGPRVAVALGGALVAFDARFAADPEQRDGVATQDRAFLDVVAARVPDAGPAGDVAILNTTRALTQSRADVAADGDRVAVTWIDHSAPGKRRVVVRLSQDGGRTFGRELAGEDDADVDHPAIAVLGARAVVVFEEARGGSCDVRALTLP